MLATYLSFFVKVFYDSSPSIYAPVTLVDPTTAYATIANPAMAALLPTRQLLVQPLLMRLF